MPFENQRQSAAAVNPSVFPDGNSPLPESEHPRCPFQNIDRVRKGFPVAPEDKFGADHGLPPRMEEPQKKSCSGIQCFPDEPSENRRAGKIPGDAQKGKEQNLFKSISLAPLQIKRRPVKYGIEACRRFFQPSGLDPLGVLEALLQLPTDDSFPDRFADGSSLLPVSAQKKARVAHFRAVDEPYGIADPACAPVEQDVPRHQLRNRNVSLHSALAPPAFVAIVTLATSYNGSISRRPVRV